MAKLILHKNGAYNVYSTISDSVCHESALTLEQLKTVIRNEYGEKGLIELPARLERAHKTGCSSFAAPETLEECISCNRAGQNEIHLSLNDFVEKYLTINCNVEQK